MKDYSFARNKKIVDVFTESELFDTSYSRTPGIIEIDRPLFLHLEDGSVLRLFGDQLSPAFEESYETQKGDLGDYHHNATPAFQCLIGKTIIAVNEIYDIVCDVEDLEGPPEKLCLDIVLDAPLLMECFYGCLFEFTQIRILLMSVCFLVRRSNMAVREKTYGVHNHKLRKVMASFAGFSRSLGVILSGDKGIGKSLFAKKLCEAAVDMGYPVVIVDACLPGIARFIESIEQECIVLFDEFDKTFRTNRDNDEQAALLSLFDGTSGGKKLFVVTCNELYGLNNYIVNRPGRFHYHFRFDYPAPENIREYLTDKLDPDYHGQINSVIEFSRKISLNYDCLRAIAFELNTGADFAEAIADLNIMTTEDEEYKVYLVLEGGNSFHNLRFQTNLYDYDGAMTYIRFYDDDGKFMVGAYFDKACMKYDVTKGKVLVPPNGIKIVSNDDDDDDYIDDNDEDADISGGKAPRFKGTKVLYMSFAKRAAKNLHYMI